MTHLGHTQLVSRDKCDVCHMSLRGSAWQFNNHFLLIDGIGGYFGGPVTLAVWFRLLQVNCMQLCLECSDKL